MIRSPLSKKVRGYLFNLKLKKEEEQNNLMVKLISLTMKPLYGQLKRKDIYEEYNIRPGNWLEKTTMIELLNANPYQVVKMLLNTKVIPVMTKEKLREVGLHF